MQFYAKIALYSKEGENRQLQIARGGERQQVKEKNNNKIKCKITRNKLIKYCCNKLN